jgi:hypothetical protein
VLREVVGIVAGFAVSRASAGLSRSRFPAWDRMVRQPLLWAGASDVAEVFRTNVDESDDAKAHRKLLWSLRQLFPGAEFKASDLSRLIPVPQNAHQHTLKHALELIGVNLGGVGISKSIGAKFKGLMGKVANVDGTDLMLAEREDGHDKVTRYRVALAGTAG